MILVRRSVLAAVLIAAIVLSYGTLSGGPTGFISSAAAQSGQTPEEICAAAIADVQEPDVREFEAAEDVLEDGADYWAVMCTEAGPIYLDLYEDEAPKTVNNFVFLASEGFYNNTTFHRVLPGFMAQGGDPTGTGSGGPGYTFEDETDNGLVFDAFGLLAMANGGPNTNGSQFFITYAPTPWLDGNHTIFGRVFEGINHAELLIPRDPQRAPAYEGATLHTVVIVDDPVSVDATPDAPPAIDHFQALLELVLPMALSQQFALDTGRSGVTDLEAEVAWWDALGTGLGDFLTPYLAEQAFVGTASVVMNLAECPDNAADLPIWMIATYISEFTSAEAAESVVFDDTRAEALEDAGAFTGHEDPADIPGRVYWGGAVTGTACSDSGQVYRLEVPYGRYVLAVELAVDDAFVTPETDPSSTQYLGFVLQDFLFNSVSGTLDRGNATLVE